MDFFHWDFSLVGEEGGSWVFTCLTGSNEKRGVVSKMAVVSIEYGTLHGDRGWLVFNFAVIFLSTYFLFRQVLYNY